MGISVRGRSWTLALLLGSSAQLAGAVPRAFNIQGRLTDANGVIRDGGYSLRFSLYDAPAGGRRCGRACSN